jgi:enoyl-CoA hydratase/carnithine racemase
MMTGTACNGRKAQRAGLWHQVALAAVLQAAMAGAASAAELSIREITPQAPALTSERRPDQLPGSSIARGKQNIAAVWLAGPTTRYDHGVLGDSVEASKLVAETRTGNTLVREFTLRRSRHARR